MAGKVCCELEGTLCTGTRYLLACFRQQRNIITAPNVMFYNVTLAFSTEFILVGILLAVARWTIPAVSDVNYNTVS